MVIMCNVLAARLSGINGTISGPKTVFLKSGLGYLQPIKSPGHGRIDAIGKNKIAEVVELIR